jgi:hypothetical protein
MAIRVDATGLTGLSQRLQLLTGDQVNRDVARALRATGVAARDYLKAELQKPSGGPIEGGATRWTLGGTYAQRLVDPGRLETEVGFASTQPRAAGRYLRPLLTGTPPVIKGIDLKLAAGQRLSYLPGPDIPRTPQGNVSRATLGSKVLKGFRFKAELKTGAIGLFVRLPGASSGGQRSLSLQPGEPRRDPAVRLVGIIARGRPRRQTLDLERMLAPVAQAEFQRQFAEQIARTLRKVGL